MLVAALQLAQAGLRPGGRRGRERGGAGGRLAAGRSSSPVPCLPRFERDAGAAAAVRRARPGRRRRRPPSCCRAPGPPAGGLGGIEHGESGTAAGFGSLAVLCGDDGDRPRRCSPTWPRRSPRCSCGRSKARAHCRPRRSASTRSPPPRACPGSCSSRPAAATIRPRAARPSSSGATSSPRRERAPRSCTAEVPAPVAASGAARRPRAATAAARAAPRGAPRRARARGLPGGPALADESGRTGRRPRRPLADRAVAAHGALVPSARLEPAVQYNPDCRAAPRSRHRTKEPAPVSDAKVTVVGAGQVGATAALLLALKDLAREVVLVDVAEGLPQGKALDMMHARSVERFAHAGRRHQRLRGERRERRRRHHRGAAAQAGHEPRRPAHRERADRARRRPAGPARPRPTRSSICVTNPLDIMVDLAWKLSGLPAERVFGMGGVLDSARFAYAIAEATGAPIGDVSALVVGAHGDAMVPLPRLSTVGGTPLTELLPADRGRRARRPHRERRRRGRGAAQDGQRVLRPGRFGRLDGRRGPGRHRRRAAELRAPRRASTASRACTCRCPRGSAAAASPRSWSCPLDRRRARRAARLGRHDRRGYRRAGEAGRLDGHLPGDSGGGGPGDRHGGRRAAPRLPRRAARAPSAEEPSRARPPRARAARRQRGDRRARPRAAVPGHRDGVGARRAGHRRERSAATCRRRSTPPWTSRIASTACA